MEREARMTAEQLETERLVLEGQMRITEERLAVLAAEHQKIVSEQMRRMVNEKHPQ